GCGRCSRSCWRRGWRRRWCSWTSDCWARRPTRWSVATVATARCRRRCTGFGRSGRSRADWRWTCCGSSTPKAGLRPPRLCTRRGRHDAIARYPCYSLTNYWYELIRVFYVDGSKEDYTTLHSGTPVDPNLRDPGRELSAQWLGQDGNDWTGNGPSVGPDGIQNFHLKVSNISTGGTVSSLVLTANPGPSAQSWQIGTNPQGYSNAEILNRVTSGGTDTADYFGKPSSSLSNGAPLTLQLTYSDQNRGGKTDTVPISAGLTVGNINPTLAMPRGSVANFAAASAHSTAQNPGFPGNSHIVLDTPLPNPETTATVQAAVLSDQAGTTWVYGSTTPYTGASPLSMSYDPNSGTFSYPPVRDESSATLTLRLLFTDG